ncbi:MAG: peptidylprolyl isomerase [Planctomycetaceae bacterium]|nr:peptidylprolyl isomerase [Planctomycetaceae bacterium]
MLKFKLHFLNSNRLEIPEAEYGSPASQDGCARPKAAAHTGYGIGILVFAVIALTVNVALAQKAAQNVLSSGKQAAPAGETKGETKKTPASQKMTFETMPEVVAEVNNVKITKQELANEAIRVHGKEYLDGMINRTLIMQECQRLGIVITSQDINQEIDAFAKRFKFTTEQWLSMLKTQNDIDYDQYANEIIWQMLALKRIAGQSINITQEEINREYESLYGPAVQVRQIVLDNKAKAEQVLQQVRANPSKENFISIAKVESKDTSSAAMGGLIPPFRRYRMQNNLQMENEIFNMQPDQISNIWTLDPKYHVIFRCERLLPAQNVDRKSYEQEIAYRVQERKLHEEAAKIFQRLTKNARVTNYFDQPGASVARIPDVVATVNGMPIQAKTLAEICAVRYGNEILQAMVIRKIIEQQCQKQNVTVTQEEMQTELSKIAEKILPLTPDGKPDVNALVEMQCREQGLTPEAYFSNVIWPMLALKKMAASAVQVTDEDMTKAYEANFGVRVQALAIFLNSERKAFEVWELARKNLTKENFAQLARDYSVETTTQSTGGQIDPIPKYSGWPQMEEIAFALKPGEISEVIPFDTVNGKQYIILYCLGRTEPTSEAYTEEVKKNLYADIYDKKMAIEVDGLLNRFYAGSTIDNYFAGKSQTPKTSIAPTATPIR